MCIKSTFKYVQKKKSKWAINNFPILSYDHDIRDKNSHLLKHANERGHIHVWDSDFKMFCDICQ